MDCEVRVLTEGFVALWAFEGALSSVNSPVGLKVGVSGETFPALATAVSLLAHQHKPLLAVDAVVVIEASVILAPVWPLVVLHE